jgi:hypothetical protein
MFYVPMKYVVIQVSLTKRDLVYNHDDLNLLITTLYALYSFFEKGYLRPDDGLRK